MSIDPQKLSVLFMDCLFTEDEIEDGLPKNPDSMVEVQGVSNQFGLNKYRLDGYKLEVKEMLDQLPEEFKEGWSFLNMCNDNDNNQWTGMHSKMEQLMIMGIGLEFVKYCMPKEMWSTFPCGMPYIIVNTEGTK